jgi:hypothetical protein
MREVVVKVVPGVRPLRVLIHWFMETPEGPVETPAGAVMTPFGPMQMGGATGRIACQPARTSVAPEQNPGQAPTLVVHSPDVRAVTCPACLATEEAKAQQKALGELLSEAEKEGD